MGATVETIPSLPKFSKVFSQPKQSFFSSQMGSCNSSVCPSEMERASWNTRKSDQKWALGIRLGRIPRNPCSVKRMTLYGNAKQIIPAAYTSTSGGPAASLTRELTPLYVLFVSEPTGTH